jgi:hypothetical protein
MVIRRVDATDEERLMTNCVEEHWAENQALGLGAEIQ